MPKYILVSYCCITGQINAFQYQYSEDVYRDSVNYQAYTVWRLMSTFYELISRFGEAPPNPWYGDF